MRKALIFGAAGFVGGYLYKELDAHGYKVYGSDILDAPENGMEYIRADLLDARRVAEVISDVRPEAIINLAAISSVGQSWKLPQTTMQVNIVGALNILEGARAIHPMPKVLFIGSSEEYAVSSEPISEESPLDANNPYGISKMAQERLAQLYREHYGMKIYCARPFNHTGVGQRDSFVIPSWCKQAAAISKSGRPGVMRVGNLNVRRDFSDVRDVVRAYRMILERGNCGVIYNIGTGNSVLLKDLLDYIVSLAKQPIAVEIDTSLIRPVDAPYICCDHSLITQELGWKPEHELFDTVREMVKASEGAG